MNWFKKLFCCQEDPRMLKLDCVVDDPEGKFRRIGKNMEDIPPRNTDYWTEEDFNKFTGKTKYGDLLVAIPRIKKHFPEINLSDEELKKVVCIVTQVNREVFLKMIDNHDFG